MPGAVSFKSYEELAPLKAYGSSILPGYMARHAENPPIKDQSIPNSPKLVLFNLKYSLSSQYHITTEACSNHERDHEHEYEESGKNFSSLRAKIQAADIIYNQGMKFLAIMARMNNESRAQRSEGTSATASYSNCR